MSFEDIDTPVSDEELNGSADPAAPSANDPADSVADDPVKVESKTQEEVAASAEESAAERNPVIPRARFDEVNAKLHAERERAEAAERRLAEIEAAKQPPAAESAVDIKALIKESKEAIMEGDTDRAAEIDFRIYQEQQRVARAEAEAKFSQQLAEREAQSAMQTVFAKSIESYPFLDHRSDGANAQAIAEVVEWRDFYSAKGVPDHVALEKAVAKVAPSYAASNPEAAPLVDTRKSNALSRNAADAAAQPPAQVAGVGNRAAPPKPKVESQQDWEKLSDADRESMLM